MMKIVNFRREGNSDKILAVFDVDLGNGVTYPNIKAIRGKTGNYFVGLPSYLKSEDAFGNKTYGKYPEFSPEKFKEFSNQVMQLLNPLMSASF